MEFVIFKKGEQSKFLLTAKNKSGLTWPEFASEIKKSRSLMFFYLREESKIPKNVFDFISKKYELEIKPQKIIFLKNTGKIVCPPELSEDFCEFLGALAGDGHLGENPSVIAITCHKILDRQYIYHLVSLFEKLFKEKPCLNIQRNVLKLYFYSKSLVSQLNEIYGHPIGKKKGNLYVPKQIIDNERYIYAYLRGLFDTDGCLCRHHKNSGAIVEISSRDTRFLKEINHLLEKLNFKTSVGYKNVNIYDRKEIDKFFNLISPVNNKHRLKYETFKKTGKVPLTKDILHRWRNG
ncbi:hypothetical protein HZA97_01300 [Candidatus Woesearchaeota archaeon]|nr:hypothetical protein [Candidatus Woesearchaeota archaeon]